jgi:ribosomal-protein-alanine N-acetyltransferase
MILPVGAEAAEALAALHARAFDRPWSASEIAKLLHNQNAFALLDADPEPKGFALAWAAAGDAELLTIAVIPEARRAGAGAALVHATGQAALARGAASLMLEVGEDNAAARGLYQKLGFEIAGRRRAYYARTEGPAVDAIVMRLPLGR